MCRPHANNSWRYYREKNLVRLILNFWKKIYTEKSLKKSNTMFQFVSFKIHLNYLESSNPLSLLVFRKKGQGQTPRRLSAPHYTTRLEIRNQFHNWLFSLHETVHNSQSTLTSTVVVLHRFTHMSSPVDKESQRLNELAEPSRPDIRWKFGVNSAQSSYLRTYISCNKCLPQSSLHGGLHHQNNHSLVDGGGGWLVVVVHRPMGISNGGQTSAIYNFLLALCTFWKRPITSSNRIASRLAQVFLTGIAVCVIWCNS